MGSILGELPIATSMKWTRFCKTHWESRENWLISSNAPLENIYIQKLMTVITDIQTTRSNILRIILYFFLTVRLGASEFWVTCWDTSPERRASRVSRYWWPSPRFSALLGQSPRRGPRLIVLLGLASLSYGNCYIKLFVRRLQFWGHFQRTCKFPFAIGWIFLSYRLTYRSICCVLKTAKRYNNFKC